MPGFLEQNRLLRTTLDTIPIPVFVVDRLYTLLDANAAGRAFLGSVADQPLRTLCGEALHCINTLAASGGCGNSSACPECVLRATVRASITQGRPVRRRWTLERVLEHGTHRLHLFVTAADIAGCDPPLSLLVFEDFTEFVEMRGLVPICGSCKKIRDDREYWEQVERHLEHGSDIGVAQSLCPECLEKHFPGTSTNN